MTPIKVIIIAIVFLVVMSFWFSRYIWKPDGIILHRDTQYSSMSEDREVNFKHAD